MSVAKTQSGRRKLRQLWSKSGCNNRESNKCKNKTSKVLKACSGCMKVGYCSKKCQKIDWNKRHRFKCDRSWNRDNLSVVLNDF